MYIYIYVTVNLYNQEYIYSLIRFWEGQNGKLTSHLQFFVLSIFFLILFSVLVGFQIILSISSLHGKRFFNWKYLVFSPFFIFNTCSGSYFQIIGAYSLYLHRKRIMNKKNYNCYEIISLYQVFDFYRSKIWVIPSLN